MKTWKLTRLPGLAALEGREFRAHTKGEARAELKRLLGLRLRLPPGTKMAAVAGG